eukprot:scaffold10685_cov104-Isochrysis_galbana.AAC.3
MRSVLSLEADSQPDVTRSVHFLFGKGRGLGLGARLARQRRWTWRLRFPVKARDPACIHLSCSPATRCCSSHTAM